MRQSVIVALLSLFLVPPLWSAGQQSGGGFDYQALVYESGSPLAEKTVGVRISLQDASAQVYYEEEHASLRTERTGLLRVPIGHGAIVQGDFASVPWGKGILVAASLNTGMGYRSLGPAVQLQAVPYAIRARANPVLRGAEINRSGDSPIFEVVNSKGEAVFSVYEEGVRIRVAGDLDSEGRHGGFSIATRRMDGSDLVRRLYLDEGMRLQVDEETGRGVRGGFAVATYSAPLRSHESVPVQRMWLSGPGMGFVLDDPGRGVRGGFAVSRRTALGQRDALSINGGAVEALVEPVSRGVRGGFAVALRSILRGEKAPLAQDSVQPLMVLDDKNSYLTMATRPGEEGGFSFRTRTKNPIPLVSFTAEGRLLTYDGNPNKLFKKMPTSGAWKYKWANFGIQDPALGPVVLRFSNVFRAAHPQDGELLPQVPGATSQEVEVALHLDTNDPLFEGLQIRKVHPRIAGQHQQFFLGLALEPDYVITQPRTIPSDKIQQALGAYLVDNPSLRQAVEKVTIELKPDYVADLALAVAGGVGVLGRKGYAYASAKSEALAEPLREYKEIARNTPFWFKPQDSRVTFGPEAAQTLGARFNVEIEDVEAFFRDGGTKGTKLPSGLWEWTKTIMVHVKSVALQGGEVTIPLKLSGEFDFD